MAANPGVIGGDEQYFHNADMAAFPERKHTGKSKTHYGIDLGVLDDQALQALLAEWLKSAAQPVALDPETPPVASFIPVYCLDGVAQNETERDALIKARIGQGAYRDALLAYWQGCAVTGCGAATVLRASHIKPWHRCTDPERLDPYNGLLLTPNLDVSFDQGLISFEDDGRIMLSPELCDSDAEMLGLWPDLRLRKVAVEHWAYLEWHRGKWFKR
ncbi:HNH endonuclease [Pseudomonas syringae]|uniref:HNH endonuclease n=1 Tax=Pseudomonas syringae TaxID=317 RepID=UPI0009B56A52|nr:HNH endonuclease [Pseudomonas syringae]